MTPEQKQQLEQIREKLRGGTHYRWDYTPDVDFLLSLVKEQEAERNQRRAPYSDECRTAIDALEERFADEEVELASIGYVHQREDYAATLMRSACVEKVRAILRDYEMEFRRQTNSQTNIVDYVVMALESVSIQEQEK